MAEEPQRRQGGKDAFRAAADEFSEDVAKFYVEVLNATKTRYVQVECDKVKGYKHKVEVPIEDWSARTNALAKLLEAGYGRPGPPKEPEKAAPELNLAALREMSDDELALYAWQEGQAVTEHLIGQARLVLATVE